jgi:hypothetical protein
MIFPGHYDGRATHVHVMARDAGPASDLAGLPIVIEDEVQASVHHIEQVYFDDSLRTEVERQSPYNLNMQKLVANNDDGFAPNQASAQYDTFVIYVYMNGKYIISKFLEMDR